MKRLFIALSLILCFSLANSQEKEHWGADLIHGIFLGKSKPLSKYSNPPGKDFKVPEGAVEIEKKNFEGRLNPGLIQFNSQPRPDPLLNNGSNALRTNTKYPEILINGIGYSNVQPPDPSGAMGAGHYIHMINGFSTLYQVFDSNGVAVTGASGMNPFWSQFGKSGLGDPIVMFDKGAQRWFLSEFANQGNTLLMAVSTSSDPLGSYNSYQFSTPNFPDYPKYGIWHDAYYCTTNEGGPSAIYSFERDSMLMGSPARMLRFTVPDLSGFGFQALTPVDWDGLEPDSSRVATFWRHNDDEAHFPFSNDTTADFLQYWEVTPDFDSAANSLLFGPRDISVSEFDSDINGYFAFSGIIQPHPSVSLDPLREVFMQKIQFRSFDTFDVITGTHVTDVDGNDWAAMRWYELRRYDTVDWFLYQEGTFAPDSSNRWMGSVSMDKNGNIALAYNVSSSTVFPSIRYTGRLSTDPLGSMTFLEQEISTGFGNNFSNRYGDYSAISIDPSDDETFWFTAEYNPSGQWGTGIGAFKLGYDCNGLYASGGLVQDNICFDSIIAKVKIVGTGGFGSYEYSLDGVNYQNDTIFSGLSGGIYKLLVRDPDSTQCVVSIPGVKVSGISPIIINGVLTQPSSSTSSDGSIFLIVSPAGSVFTYSLDGVNYQSSALFSGLSAGLYTVFAMDSKGCLGLDTFELAPAVGIQDPVSDLLKIYPNPNSGIFWLEFEGPDEIISNDLVRVRIFSESGKTVSAFPLDLAKNRKRVILDPGFYVIRGISKDGRTLFTKQIMVNR
jgi:hypothetical protein